MMRGVKFSIRILISTLNNGTIIRLVIERSKRLKVRLVDAENLFLHRVRKGSDVQKVRVGNQVRKILDVAQLGHSAGSSFIKSNSVARNTSCHRMFTSLFSVNHSVLSDCCPIAAINPIDGIVVQPIQRGKRFSIEIERFQYRIHDVHNGAGFCNASAGFVGIDPHAQGNGSILASAGRITMNREIAVFLYLHTWKLFDVAVIDFASDEDTRHLLSQFLGNSCKDRIEIINQLFQTSLHVAST
nr:MAG TPA: hypothetical protein [Caudoviricetes sp.]